MRDAYRDRELDWARNLALCLSVLAWMALAAGQFRMAPTLCPCVGAGTIQSWSSMRMLLSANPPISLAAGWLLMLAAMMAPALIAPVWHIRVQSLARRRVRSTALFVAGYAAVWVAAGCVLMGIEIVAQLLAPAGLYAAGVVAITALIWQCSPLKQVCLNRCHAHRALCAFGAAADRDALKFGLEHGYWCVGSCWALMLFPMLLPQGHLAAMAIVGVFMWGERIERPRSPAWRVRGIGRALRAIGAWGTS